MTRRRAYISARNIALFLDVDGTLIEIAATPDAVKVPAALRNTLQLAAERENGALALISGRTIRELDRLFAPYSFPASGQHGLERRDAYGNLWSPKIDVDALRPVRERLVEMVEARAGLLLEDKSTSLAVHYRLAPKLEGLAHATMAECAAQLDNRFTLRFGKCVVELVPVGYSKRAAIEAFMAEAPYAGRVPVFVGDDATDEEGFEAVNALGGYSIRVGRQGPTAAQHRFVDVAAVIRWLRQRNVALSRGRNAIVSN
jgi:trehalose 6-phosphate phosphatase